MTSADVVFHGGGTLGSRPAAGGSSAGTAGEASVYRLALTPTEAVDAAVRRLSQHPLVQYAEPDYIAHTFVTPTDPLYPQQWGLPRIEAPAAWDTVTGSPAAPIAVIDSGIDATHADLAGQLWTNPGEIAGNGLDDDSNGIVDDVNGWSALGSPTGLTDLDGHGTEVAGVIAAAANNAAGGAGVCWGCRLMIVKVVQAGGTANYSDIAAGIVYAAQKGARVTC